MTRVLAGIVLFAVASVSPAATPSPDPKSLDIPPVQLTVARELVRQLASDAFRERDAASRKLSDMGREALPALIEGSRDSVDAEVRMRCEVLLPRAESDDMKAKVDVFLADMEGKYNHDLPGWEKFKEICGNDKAARELFADIIKVRENHELLIATRLPADDMKRVVDARKRQLQFRMQPVVHTPNFRPRMPTLAEGAALILAEAVAPEKEDGWNGFTYHTQNLFYQLGEVQTASRGQGKYGPAFRKLAIKWLDTRDGVQGIQVAVGIAQQIGLGASEVGRMYVKMLTIEGQNAQWMRQQALGHLARTNAKEHLPAVVKLLTDTTVLMPAVNQPGYNQPEVLVSDFAFAVACHLTGQKPSDYGLKITPGRHNNNQFHDAGYMHFPPDKEGKADDARAAAVTKWKEWEKANTKKDEPKPNTPKP